MKTRTMLVCGLVLCLVCGWWRARQKSEATGEVAPPSKRPTAIHKGEQLPLGSPLSPAPGQGTVQRQLADRDPAGPSVKETNRRPEIPALAQFEDWVQRYAGARTEVERRALEAEGEELARDRRPVIARLIESDPELALQMAVPARERQGLPPSITQHLEERVSGRGTFAVMAVAPMPGGPLPTSPIQRFVHYPSRHYRAFVYGRRLSQTTKENVPLHGIAVDDAMAVHASAVRVLEEGETPAPAQPVANDGGACPISQQAASPVAAVDVGGTIHYLCRRGHIEAFRQQIESAEQGIAPSPASTNWTHGPKTLLYVRANFPDDLTDMIRLEEAQAVMVKVNEFFVANSYGATSIRATVTPLLTLPQTKEWYRTNDMGQLLADARETAQGAGYNTEEFDLDCVLYQGIFPFGGAAYVGAKGCWLQTSDVGVANHEFGHNYGLLHANAWEAKGESIIGPGRNIEYGNPFDTMGSTVGQFNAYNRRVLDWLPAARARNATSGVYRLHSFETTNLDAGRNYALVAPKDVQRDYWVEMRQADTNNLRLQNGVLVHWSAWDQSSGGSQLLDMHPASQSYRQQAALPFGRTFTDPEAGVHITPLWKNGTSPESIDVRINVGPFAGNEPPRLTLNASTTNAAVNAPIQFTASATDANGDTLAYWWDFGDGSFSTNTPSLTHRWASDGEYLVRCVATDMKGGVNSAWRPVRIGQPFTYRVSGRITLNGQPVEGARVEAVQSGHQGVTDGNGDYLIVGLPAGRHSVRAIKPYYLFTPTQRDVVLAATNIAGQNFIGQSTTNPNSPPFIRLTWPPDQSTFPASPEPMELYVETLDDGMITNVTFLVNGQALGRTTNYPFHVGWSNAPAGNYILRAEATDDDGLTGHSSETRVALVSGAPGNDHFTNRIRLSGNRIGATNHTVMATREPDEPIHPWDGNGPSIWYEWTPSSSGPFTITTEGSQNATLLAVYTGTSFAEMTRVAVGFTGGARGEARLTFRAVAGTAYQIAVQSYSWSVGTILLDIHPASPPPNDDFANRIFFTGAPASINGSNTDASAEPGEPTYVSMPQASVWWAWRAPASGKFTVSTEGSRFNAVLNIYAGASLAELTPLAGNFFGAPDNSAVATFKAQAGVTYAIAVDGVNGFSGAIALSVRPAQSPPNDDFAARLPLSGPNVTTNGSNVDASKEPGEPLHGDNLGGASIWWTWQAPASGLVAISTEGTEFQSLLGIYTGAAVDGLTTIASDWSSRRILFRAVAGTFYQIAVDGNYSRGNVRLTIAPAHPPSNDDFAQRRPLSGLPAADTGSNRDATLEPAEPAHHPDYRGGHSVWWSWTSPRAGRVIVSTEGSRINTLLAVYSGASPDSLTLVGYDAFSGNDGTSRLSFVAAANATYQIAVDGVNGADGDLTLNVVPDERPPALLIHDAARSEGDSGVTDLAFTVTLTNGLEQPVTVDFRTVPVTAIAGVDFAPSNGTLLFVPGQTEALIHVALLGDLRVEPDERFRVELSNPNGAFLENTEAIGTIANDDFRAVLAADSPVLTAESMAPANGAIDPGERVTLTVSLRNVGNADTANLTATLLEGDGVTAPSSTQNYGALAAGGAAVVRSFAFTARGPTNAPLVASFQLRDGQASVGTVRLTFRLGPAGDFALASLGTDDALAVEHNDVTGDDRGGLAVTPARVLVTGDRSTGTFSATDFSDGTSLGVRYEGLTANLRTETAYALGEGSALLAPGGGVVTSLLELDNFGELTGNRVTLSAAIDVLGAVGIFAGYDRVVIHNGARVYSIALPWGIVSDLGEMAAPVHQASESWAYWGVAESAGQTVNLVLVENSRRIARVQVPDGAVSVVSTFANLSDMASFSVSPSRSRWFFHHEGSSEFRSGDETVGSASAWFTFGTNPPVLLTQPANRVVAEGSTVTIAVVVAGSPPLRYQWRKNAVPLAGATNQALQLSNLTAADAGSYSVVVSNAFGSTTSTSASLMVIPVPPTEDFEILELRTSGAHIAEHNVLTGDDRGGIALSDTHVFYTGDSSTARFGLDLADGTALGRMFDALVTDLRTQTVYSLADAAGPLTSAGGVLTRLLEHDGATGELNGNFIELSHEVPLTENRFNIGLFAGYGRVVIHTGTHLYDIRLPEGLVIDMGPAGFIPHASSENWAYWGVAESIGGQLRLVAVQDSKSIARTFMPDGPTEALAGFSNLSDMAAFTVSVPLNRWYFHYEGTSQFGGSSETIGYAEAVLRAGPCAERPPVAVRPPASRLAVTGSLVVFDVVVTGCEPLNYQWQHDDVPLAGATNATLTLTDVQPSAAGRYSVRVSNPYGATLIGDATLTVIESVPVAYVTSTGGEPWGSLANSNALNRAFGPGVWLDLRFETLNPATLFGPSVRFVYVEGSDRNANLMEQFLADNAAVIESWVTAGGRLFLNAAPNVGDGMALGFGVQLVNNDATQEGLAAQPQHPLFQGPFLPVGVAWSGSSFAHATVTGPDLTPLIINRANGRTVLAEKTHGRGHVLFGGMTMDNFHSPQPEAAHLRANILAYTSGGLDHFSWSSVGPTQQVGVPFLVSLVARDALGRVATDFNGHVALSGRGSAVSVFSADFESGLNGFAVDNNVGSGGGLWHRSTGRSLDPGHSPGGTLYFGRGEGPAGGGNYDAGIVEGSALAPVINLATAQPPLTLTFQYLIESEADIDFDLATVELSTNNGATWFVAAGSKSVGGLTSMSQGVWLAAHIDLSAWVGRSLLARWRFATIDDQNNAFEGWYVDDVRVWHSPSIPLNPVTVGPFINGVWTGYVTVGLAASDVVLRAEDGQGRAGESEAFTAFGETPKLQIVHAGNSVIVSWPAATPGFRLEAANSLNADAIWLPVRAVPGLVGNQFVLNNTISGRERYFRLRRQ